MPWQKTFLHVEEFDDVFTRLSARIETAKSRQAQLIWKNYRQWYQKLVRDTRKLLRRLKKTFIKDTEMFAILARLEGSLQHVFDIESDTAEKWNDISHSRTIWQRFRDELEKHVKQEYDLFPRRNFDVDGKLCFVLMPFDKGFKAVYTKAIKPSITYSGLKAKRADEIFAPTPIVRDIWEYINKATLIIADVTDRNANVFYEVGISHALPKRLIIVTQRKEDVPFDIQHIRWIKYKNSKSGLHQLRVKLQKTIKSMLA